jgi:hypothetical protein
LAALKVIVDVTGIDVVYTLGVPVMVDVQVLELLVAVVVQVLALLVTVVKIRVITVVEALRLVAVELPVVVMEALLLEADAVLLLDAVVLLEADDEDVPRAPIPQPGASPSGCVGFGGGTVTPLGEAIAKRLLQARPLVVVDLNS